MTEHRIISVGLVWNNKGELLLCRMDPQRGVFPGEWSLPGGGIHPGEKMQDALRREMREELGIEISQIKPAFFKDATYPKLLPDGSSTVMYMIFLIFHCLALGTDIRLNEEFIEYRWVSERTARDLALNQESKDTLSRINSWGLPGEE